MSSLDDITKQEAEIIRNSIIYIESGDHLITDEAKRHKLALMIACAFVFMISLYPNAHIGSLFGIVKFTDESEISILKIIPYALLVMAYQGVMYAYHLNEAKKAQLNKKLKSIREKNFHSFNEFIDKSNDTLEAIENYQIRDVTFNQESGRFSQIRRDINDYDTKLKTIPNFHPHLTNLVMWSQEIINNANRNKQTVTLQEIPIKTIRELHNEGIWLIHRVEIFKDLNHITDGLKLRFTEIDKICDELDGHFIEKYNYYLTRLFDIRNEHSSFINESIEDKQTIMKNLSETAYSEKNAFYIYTVIPTVFFLVSLGFGLFTYITSFLEKCPYVN
ncbi:TPA: hypothetical protein NKV98_003973 [Vibrio parahaemolyticus]|uniref:hypothetical protein n=1 Tax=Vibrio parahaemolyticus TaxID=670 RepID=UPI0009335B7B|nr:hypothetical protein [Vibrio parahaemolyticus]TPA17965.1 hypothetical protein DXJ89_16865 [Vibrio parahaemolyticus]TPA43126.1 hypothetical protein DXJ91_16870 [Vibrio parahaemolyticus]HCE2533514.1 hypothetical protein [Vibrio parahaemolyticus]HCE4721242.1 hypothetical protein [Vibrio parahaemolyticus]HCE4920920.1 hypothetical protein [Vibrio parahaemolyticus]